MYHIYIYTFLYIPHIDKHISHTPHIDMHIPLANMHTTFTYIDTTITHIDPHVTHILYAVIHIIHADKCTTHAPHAPYMCSTYRQAQHTFHTDNIHYTPYTLTFTPIQHANTPNHKHTATLRHTNSWQNAQ